MGSERGHRLTLGREGGGKAQGRRQGGGRRAANREEVNGAARGVTIEERGQGRGTNNGALERNALVVRFGLSSNHVINVENR